MFKMLLYNDMSTISVSCALLIKSFKSNRSTSIVMTLRKPMTPTEIKFFKEKVIREYKDKYLPKKKPSLYVLVVRRLKQLLLYNIVIGVVVSIIFIWIYGWSIYLRTLLTVIIVTTIGTTIAGMLLKKK